MIPAWSQRIYDLLQANPSKTVTGLARACDIAQPSVSNWFGKGTPTKMISGDNLISAASYLGVSAEYIMTGRRSGSSTSSVSESKETRLDPLMISQTYRALCRVYKSELNRQFLLEKESVRFVLAYEIRSQMSVRLTDDELIAFGAKLVDIVKREGVSGNGDGQHRGRGDGVPAGSPNQGGVAGRIQRKAR